MLPALMVCFQCSLGLEVSLDGYLYVHSEVEKSLSLLTKQCLDYV